VKRWIIAAAAGAWLLAAAVPASAQTQHELVTDSYAQAFTLRAQVDYGGASKLPFFFGSYADATLNGPPAEADGQASWYNLGIAETAAFTPPGQCTPEEQQRRLQQAAMDVSDWVVGVAVPTLLDQRIPVLPLPTLPCTERLPGFAQSRYPDTATIHSSSSDDLMGSGLCSAGACAIAQPLGELTNGIVDGGRFVATSNDRPSQDSDATIAGLHIPGVLDIASARSIATAAITNNHLITEATWTAADVCIVPTSDGCTVSIRSIRQLARIERDANGRILSRTARTIVAGISGGGQAHDVTTADLGPGSTPIDLGGHLQLRAISSTSDCGDPKSKNVADTGGLEITGEGGGGPSVSLPLPIAGSATGGGLLLGGACVNGTLQSVSFDIPALPGGGTVSVPGTTVTVPALGGGVGVPGVTSPVLSGPRVIAKDVVHYVSRSAPAWRTAPYWGTTIGLLMLACAVLYLFRDSRPVSPVVAAVDRFSRQFIRG